MGKRGDRWTQRKRKRPGSGGGADEEAAGEMADPIGEPAPDLAAGSQLRSTELAVPALLEQLPLQLSHAQLARLLWTTCYARIFVSELGQYSHVATRLHELYLTLRSSRQGELLADRATVIRLASNTAALAREQSERALPFSVVAKSISYLMQRVPIRVWACRVTRTSPLLFSSSRLLSPSLLSPLCSPGTFLTWQACARSSSPRLCSACCTSSMEVLLLACCSL